MKRVLVALLCVLFVLCGVLVACDDGGEGAHVHTFKTTWSKDVSGHWYDATCGCEDAPKVVLAHSDANNDGACDVCTYTDHEHTYSEDYTADCTNHWNAADCGHVVAGINVEAHADGDGDGVCDTCKYVIEDLHQHIYATEWSHDGEYHWHAAICEHQVEVADKAAHVINDAGYCTVCDSKINDVDTTDILAVLKAAIANNYKVVTGNVELEQIVYNGSEKNNTLTVLDKSLDGVYFVLGNGQSYYFQKDYDENGTLIGGEQQWFEQISEEDIFGVKMDVNSYELDKIAGYPEKLQGYTYMPGSILAAGYDDTTTLAQTLYNFYDLMTNGENVSDATSNYDAETGKYSFSFTYFTVNEVTTQGVVSDIQLALYETEIEFTVNDDFVIDVANFQVKVYNYYDQGNAENDLVYDKATNTMTKTDEANPSYYIYDVYQTSGERTFTTPYPKASLLPQGINYYYVENFDFPNAFEFVIIDETPLGDTITIPAGTYAYFHIGDPYPSTSSLKFVEFSDVSFSFVNNDPTMDGKAWYDSDTPLLNGYVSYSNCLKIKLRDPGTYTVTFGFGEFEKVFTLVIPGEETPIVEPDTENKLNFYISDTNSYETDYEEYTATLGEGHYTFTLPAGVGMEVDGDRLLDFVETPNGGQVTIDLEANETIRIYFAAGNKAVYSVDVAYEAAEIEDDPIVIPDVNTKALNPNGNNQVEGADIAFAYTPSTSGKLTIKYGAFVPLGGVTPTGTVVYTINGGEPVVVNGGNVDNVITLAADDQLVITVLTNTYTTIISSWEATPDSGDEGGDEGDDTLQGSGTEQDPYIITTGDYVADYKGSDVGHVYYSFTATQSGFVTYTSTFDETPWFYLGQVSNEGAAESLSTFLPAGETIIIRVGDWDEREDQVPFTISFEAKTSDDFSALVGTWYAESDAGWAIVTYELTINANGTGTLSYDTGYGAIECAVYYVFVDGQNVTIGYRTTSGAGSLECTYDGTTFACTSGAMQDSFTFSDTPVSGGDSTDDGKVYGGGTLAYGENTVVVTADDKAAGSFTLTFIADKTTEHKFSSGNLYIQKVTGPDGDIAKVDYMYSLVEGTEYTLTISFMLAQAGEHDMIISTPNYVEPSNDTADVVGSYSNVNGYNLFIMENSSEPNAGDYIVEIYNDSYSVDLYFTVVATANGDGSYTLALEYVSRPDYESGTDSVDAILAETFVVTPSAGGDEGGEEDDKTPLEALNGTYLDAALEGNNVGFFQDTDTSVYYLNVYGGTQDLYYTAVPTENADGTITLALTLCTDHWSYFGNVVTDEYELDGKNVVATPAGDSWTFTVEGAGSGDEDTADGTFENPYELKESNTCEFPGGGDFVWYAFTAPTAGKATISVSSDDYFWAYAFNASSVENVGQVPTASLDVTAGQTIYIGMASYSYDPATIEFTATFEPSAGGSDEPAQGTSTNPFELQESNTCEFAGGNGFVYYVYTATEAGSLTITVNTQDSYWCFGADVNNMENIGNVQTATFPLNAGDVVYVGMSTNSTNAGTVEFTATFAAGSSEETIVETPLVMGNNSVNAADIYFAYTATADIELAVQVGNPAMGAVTVTYTINGGTEIALTNGETTNITLTAGDKLVIAAKTTSGYQTIAVSEVVAAPEAGTSENPIVVETLPYEIKYTGNHDYYYAYTATEDIVLTVTAPSGCYVSNDKSVTATNGVYVFNLVAGESVSLNLWTMSAAETEYTYTITGAAPSTGGGEGGGEATGADGVYLASHASGRNFQVTIDSAAGTITIIRSDLTGSLTTGGATTYSSTYSFDGSTVTYGGTYAMQFDENGAPTQLIWGSATVTGFVKQ